MEIVGVHIQDKRIHALVSNIIGNFSTCPTLGVGQIGLPLGNLTSQLLVNIYMNEFDQFVKHTLKAKYYIRYADDFVVLSHDRNYLLKTLPYMEVFLRGKLKLVLHPEKTFIQTLASGMDFLGWVHFPDHRVLRTSTKRRMLEKLRWSSEEATITSYKGMLSHGNARKLTAQILKTDGK